MKSLQEYASVPIAELAEFSTNPRKGLMRTGLRNLTNGPKLTGVVSLSTQRCQTTVTLSDRLRIDCESAILFASQRSLCLRECPCLKLDGESANSPTFLQFCSCNFRSSAQRLYCSTLAGSGSSSPFSQNLNQSTLPCCDVIRSHGLTNSCAA